MKEASMKDQHEGSDMKHVTEDQLVDYRYGEGDAAARGAIQRHLASCDACRESFETLEGVLAAVDAAPIPERGEDYGAQVWQRLAPRLRAEQDARRESWWRFLTQPSPWRRWAAAGAMAALVLGAFYLGRRWPRQAPPIAQTQPVPAEARERVLLVAVGDHLERSQMVLVELENAKGSGPVDISSERDRAQQLVASNRLYRQTAARSGDVGMASVLDELERVLVEIAHSPSEISQARLDELRHRIEAQGILFKVRVINSEVEQKERTAAQKAGQGAS